MLSFIYNFFLLLSALFLIPWFGLKILLTGKYRQSIRQKLGFIPRDISLSAKGSPRIWIHAVSVGEVNAAAPVITELRKAVPEACLILSTSTETGQAIARRIAHDATVIIYFPLDVPFIIKRAITSLNPDIFAAVETEIWPNFIRICHQSNIRIAMINGRISPRSFQRYRLTRFFWKKIFDLFDAAGMISPLDACRIKAIGMPTGKIRTMGNSKYDSLAARVSLEDKILQAAARLQVAADVPVLVAGSTHAGEEEIILKVYRKLLTDYPEMKLIIAPRHVERANEVLTLTRQAGFHAALPLSRLSGKLQLRSERLLVVDRIGELFTLYSLATLVYCGGSLVPKGGQNILEPAAWGKVVLYGPSMDDFLMEKKLLEEMGAGIEIRDAKDLLNTIRQLLQNPQDIIARGRKGQSAIMANRGAAQRYASLILNLLAEK